MPRVTAPTSRPKTRVSATIAQIELDVGTDDRTARARDQPGQRRTEHHNGAGDGVHGTLVTLAEFT